MGVHDQLLLPRLGIPETDRLVDTTRNQPCAIRQEHHTANIAGVARELLPVMQEQGSEEEQAALALGASGWQNLGNTVTGDKEEVRIQSGMSAGLRVAMAEEVRRRALFLF